MLKRNSLLKWALIIALALTVTLLYLFQIMDVNRGDPELKKNSWGTKDQIVAAITPLKTPLEISKVGSVAQYIALVQMNRTLIKMNKNLQLEGDIASSWSVDPTMSSFTFKMKPEQKFSDGSVITPSNVVCSISRQMKLDSAIHFDFNEIKSVNLNNEEVVISLKKPNPRFLQQLSHPEFSILSIKNCARKDGEIDWSITSGPYYLVETKPGELLLKQNRYFENFTAPSKLKIIGSTRDEMISLLKESEIDFCLGTGEVEELTLSELTEKGEYEIKKPHIGFTYWLNINEFNPNLKDLEARKNLQFHLYNAVSNIPFAENPSWTRALQMYLPDGAGRLERKEVDKFWSNVPKVNYLSPISYKIKLLLQKSFKWNELLLKALKESNLDYEVDYYADLTEFAQLTQEFNKKYHLILINNDYSSPDLFENLKVTFNKNRPLIFQESQNKQFEELLKTAEHSIELDKSYQAYREIEKIMLEQAFVFPLFHNHMNFFVKSGVNIDEWSKLSPEVSFWKITPKF